MKPNTNTELLNMCKCRSSPSRCPVAEHRKLYAELQASLNTEGENA